MSGAYRTASRDADCGHIIDQPILWLDRSVVLGGVPGQCEAFGKLLLPDAGPETGRTRWYIVFCLVVLLQLLNAVPRIILPNCSGP